MYVRRDQDFFWEGVDRGELLAQKCDGCGTLRHPPSPRCGACGSLEWHGAPLSGRGTILAFIQSVHPSRRDEHPRCVCLVDLDEGLRMVSTLLDPENGRNGAPVSFEIVERDGVRLPFIRTLEDGQ